jgi:anti-sigma factor RsiW
MNKDKTENVQSQQCESVRELLSPYIDRQVSLDERQQVETHLASCATCQGELDQIRAVVTGLKALPQMAVPRSFALTRQRGAAPACRSAHARTWCTCAGWRHRWQRA